MMNNENLRELAEDIRRVIEKHDVDFHKFAVNITITDAYFEVIKDTLQSKSMIPSLPIFSEVDETWAINLATTLPMGNKTVY